jgi:hypothetical protein
MLGLFATATQTGCMQNQRHSTEASKTLFRREPLLEQHEKHIERSA